MLKAGDFYCLNDVKERFLRTYDLFKLSCVPNDEKIMDYNIHYRRNSLWKTRHTK